MLSCKNMTSRQQVKYDMMAAMNGSEMYVMHQSVLQTAKNKYILCKFIKLDLRTIKCNSGIIERSHRQT